MVSAHSRRNPVLTFDLSLRVVLPILWEFESTVSLLEASTAGWARLSSEVRLW